MTKRKKDNSYVKPGGDLYTVNLPLRSLCCVVMWRCELGCPSEYWSRFSSLLRKLSHRRSVNANPLPTKPSHYPLKSATQGS